MRKLDPMPFMGMASGLVEVRLTNAERITLRRAQDILDRLRDLRGQKDYDEDEMNVDIAMASYTLQQLADEGKVDA
jgi:hypothetical protein